VLFTVRRQTWQVRRFEIFESARHFRIESNRDVRFEFESSLEASQVSSLQLFPPAEVPKLLRAEVYISGPPRGVPRFIRLFKVQNKLMYTDRWVLRHQQQTDKGQLIVWGINQESAAALAAVDYRPHYGLSRVTFRVSHGQSSVGDN